ncbi:MAG: hypothetical protein COA67_11560 [Lutibacter sp.]|nr:MAG: hypothetical protein COA67_11560 [Lutibacter sp.]
MGQDIKEMLKNDLKTASNKLSEGHKSRFENRLDKELPKKKNLFSFLRIAASILVLVSVGLLSYQYINSDKISPDIVQTDEKKINSIADISPDLKKVEDYYLTNINYQISKIKITDVNKDLLEVYFSQLGELQKEYDKLNSELKIDEDVNEETIDKLIENLQMRLLLLKQLKKKLNKIENLNLKQNESSLS